MSNTAVASPVRYPAALIELLQARFGLRQGDKGAVICNGSFRLAELFLRHGDSVTLIEQNAGQRAAFAQSAAAFAHATVQAGSPDATGLADHSVDFIASDRLLFFPDQAAARQELRRILRPGGPIALVTDNRVYTGGAQAEEYEDILRRFCPGFREKALPYDLAGTVAQFFFGGDVYEDAFIAEQALTLPALAAQTAALPIYPPPGDPRIPQLTVALEKHFRQFAIEGEINIPTICRVAFGHLPS